MTRTGIRADDLHKYFAVRESATGRTLRLLGGDLRYAVTGPGLWDYRLSADGEFFLVESAVYSHPWGRPVRLSEVEPLPGGAGRYHPAALDLADFHLAETYEGSWRQWADRNPPLPRPGQAQRPVPPGT